MTDTVIYFALVGLASATDAATSVAAAAWQDYLTVRNVLIACFIDDIPRSSPRFEGIGTSFTSAGAALLLAVLPLPPPPLSANATLAPR